MESPPKLNLLCTILGQKYCICSEMSRTQHCVKYKCLNLYNQDYYLLQFYQLGQLSPQNRSICRYKILRRAELHMRVESPYLSKCYDIYEKEHEGYLGIVWELLDNNSNDKTKQLVTQMELNRMQMMEVMKCMDGAVQGLHEFGFLVKRIDPNKVFFHNGVYKLSYVELFESEQQKQCLKYAPQVREKQIETQAYLSNQNKYKCDIFALGIFYLEMLSGWNFKVLSEESESLYTIKLETNIVNRMLVEKQENIFLKDSLILAYENRMTWQKYKSMSLCWKSVKDSYDFSPLKPQSTKRIITFTLLNQQEQRKYNISNFISNYSNNYCSNYCSNQTVIQQNRPPIGYISCCSIDYDFPTYIIIRDFWFRVISSQDLFIILRTAETSLKQNKEYIQCLYATLWVFLRVDFILDNLIEVIEKAQQKKSTHIVEFMYLVVARCLFDVDQASERWRNMPEQMRRMTFVDQGWISDLIKRVRKVFEQRSSHLTRRQYNKFEIMKNLIIRSKEQKIEYNAIMGGVQKLDFTRDEQINYTVNYLKQVIQELNEIKYKYEEQKTEKATAICMHYKKLMYQNQDACQNLTWRHIRTVQDTFRDHLFRS